MWLSICVCVCLVVSCSFLPVEGRLVSSTAAIGSPFSVVRRTRAVHYKFGKLAVAMGKKAIKLLLKGSTKVPTTAPHRLYEKSGSFAKAVEDFRSINPKGKHDFQTPTGIGKVGRVGDRLFVIHKVGPDTGKPTIDIVKIDNASKSGDRTGVSGDLTDRIVYKD